MSQVQEVGAEIIHVFSPPDGTPMTDTWHLLKVRGCATTREVANALGITRKAAWERLRRLVKRGYVEARLIDGVVWWCLAKDAPSTAPRRKSRGPSRTTLGRIEAARGFIKWWGCVTTAALRRKLGLSEMQARYVAYNLLPQGIVQKMVGATALWCRDSAAAQAHVERLRDVVRRLIVQNGVRYATAAKVLELIMQDNAARLLFSKYISLKKYRRGFPAASIAFISDILTSLYGPPVSYSKRDVYFVAQNDLEALPDHVARCCAALKTHIERRLASAKGNIVSIKASHLTKDAELLPRYSRCLSKLLKPYRWGSSYVIPRGEARDLLNRLEQLCAVLRRRKKGGRRVGAVLSTPRLETATVTFYLAKDELAALDKYAEEVGATRSDVIRQAVEQFLEKMETGGYDNLRA